MLCYPLSIINKHYFIMKTKIGSVNLIKKIFKKKIFFFLKEYITAKTRFVILFKNKNLYLEVSKIIKQNFEFNSINLISCNKLAKDIEKTENEE